MGLKENLQTESVSRLPCREAILIQPETSIRQAGSDGFGLTREVQTV